MRASALSSLVLLSLLHAACATSVSGHAVVASDDRDASPPRDVPGVARDATNAPRSLALPIEVTAMGTSPDGALVVGGSWSGETAFAGHAPSYDPARPAWRGALAWIDPDRRLASARVFAERDEDPTHEQHGVSALAHDDAGALWVVLGAPCAARPVGFCVRRLSERTGEPSWTANPAALGNLGVVQAWLSPGRSGMTTCVLTGDETSAPSSSRTVRWHRPWCGWIAPDGAVATADFSRLDHGLIPPFFVLETSAVAVFDGGFATLRYVATDDPDRWDSLRDEERARITRGAFLEEAAASGPVRQSLIERSGELIAPLTDGRLRVVARTPTGVEVLDLGRDRANLTRVALAPLRDETGYDVLRAEPVAHAITARGLVLVLSGPPRGLALVEIDGDARARLVAVVPDLRGASVGSVVVTETPRAWVLAQSGRLDGPDAPIRAELRWLER